MNSVETTGKTVDEAIAEALIKLQAPSDKVTIEVLDEGNKGLLGLFGKSAHIRATLKEDEENLEKEILGDEKSTEATEENKHTEPVQAKKIPEKVPEAETTDTLPSDAQSELDAIRSYSGKKQEKQVQKKKSAEKKQEESVKAAASSADSSADEAVKEDAVSENAEETADHSYGNKPSVHDEGVDVEKTAALFLMDVLEAMGLETAINTSLSEDLVLDIDIEDATGEKGMGVVIGKRGQTLDALQYLTTMVVNKTVQEHIRVKIDVENYRERRQKTLENLAYSLARKVKKTGRKVTLEPMNPYERRIIHFALQDDPGVDTHSEGEEPYRKVVITPTRNNNQRKSKRS